MVHNTFITSIIITSLCPLCYPPKAQKPKIDLSADISFSFARIRPHYIHILSWQFCYASHAHLWQFLRLISTSLSPHSFQRAQYSFIKYFANHPVHLFNSFPSSMNSFCFFISFAVIFLSKLLIYYFGRLCLTSLPPLTHFSAAVSCKSFFYPQFPVLSYMSIMQPLSLIFHIIYLFLQLHWPLTS